jgi:hypothetical protein
MTRCLFDRSTVVWRCVRSAVPMAAISFAGFAACTPSRSDNSTKQTRTIVFGVADARYAIALPANATLDTAQALNDTEPSRVTAHFAVGARRDPTITLTVDSGALFASAASLTLLSGARLDYRDTVYAPEGSGGSESQLTGRVKFSSGRMLRVQCDNQSEAPSPVPTWCVAFLHSLRELAQH